MVWQETTADDEDTVSDAHTGGVTPTNVDEKMMHNIQVLLPDIIVYLLHSTIQTLYTVGVQLFCNCTATDQSAADYTLLHSNECKKCNRRLIGRNGGVVVMDDYKSKQNSERC